MFNFYLHGNSYRQANAEEIEDNLCLLNDLVIDERKQEDFFYKNESIWGIETVEGAFGEVVFTKFKDKQFSSMVVPKLLESIQSIDNDFATLADFDAADFKVYNAFYGPKFEDPSEERHIATKEAYLTYRKKNLWELNSKTLWERRALLFSKITLCPSVEQDLEKIGTSYLVQIKDILCKLDRYVVDHWKEGDFSYKDANGKSSLRMSPETSQTMAKYANQRTFTLPDGRRECFELHVKTGNLRFHFYPENLSIYIGYIGKHLDTVSN